MSRITHALGFDEAGYAKRMQASWPFSTVPTALRNTGAWTIAFDTGTKQGPAILCTQGAAAANKILQIPLMMTGGDNFQTDSSQFRKCRFSGWMAFLQGGVASNTMYGGIEVGSPDSLPPFPANPNNAYAQLVWNYGTQTYQLRTAIGDGSPELVTPIDSPQSRYGQTLNQGGYLELETDIVNNTLNAYIEGIQVAQIIGANFPQWTGFPNANGITFGMFGISGSAAGQIGWRASMFHYNFADLGAPTGGDA